MERRGKSAVPLPGADGGMALFPQPQLLQGYANADLQKLNAARWICFNPRWPAAHGRSTPVPLAASPSPHAERWCEPERSRRHISFEESIIYRQSVCTVPAPLR